MQKDITSYNCTPAGLLAI